MNKLELFENDLPDHNKKYSLKDSMEEYHSHLKTKMQLTEKLILLGKEKLTEREKVKSKLIECIRKCEAARSAFNHYLESEGIYDLVA
jgi:vacuolar-type H+-ATPase catalytic subunit A/Vma1